MIQVNAIDIVRDNCRTPALKKKSMQYMHLFSAYYMSVIKSMIRILHFLSVFFFLFLSDLISDLLYSLLELLDYQIPVTWLEEMKLKKQY